MSISDPNRLDQDVALDYELSIPRYAEVGGDTLRFLPFGADAVESVTAAGGGAALAKVAVAVVVAGAAGGGAV